MKNIIVAFFLFLIFACNSSKEKTNTIIDIQKPIIEIKIENQKVYINDEIVELKEISNKIVELNNLNNKEKMISFLVDKDTNMKLLSKVKQQIRIADKQLKTTK